MRHGDVMKDPFYAGIVFEIERKITGEDQRARSQGIVLTDSQVISMLTKVLGAAEGKPAKMAAASNAREEFLAELVGKLTGVRHTLRETDEEGADAIETASPLGTLHWVRALRCVVESARMRKGSIPGSRDYLDFLGPFIADALRDQPPV